MTTKDTDTRSHLPAAEPLALRLSEGLGPNAPELTSEKVCNIGFAVLRAHNDDRLWRALTYDSGPYDLTTPNLALRDLGQAFYAAGYADAPKTTMKVEVSSDHEMVRRTLRAEAEVALLRAALTLPAVPGEEERAFLYRDLSDYLRHVIDMAKGEHYLDVVRLNAEALLKRVESVLGPNVKLTGMP